jgi:hypothetical protein
MRAIRRTVLPAALAAATAWTPATAATRCVGEASTVYACVTTPGVSVGSQTYCVYTGGSTCQDVEVPMPATSGTVGVTCHGGPTLLRFFC